MAVIWRETKKDGSVIVTRDDMDAGTVEVLDVQHVPQERKASPGSGGYWLKSRSNGFVGTEADRINHMKADAALGVECDYKPVMEAGNGRKAYVACHRYKSDFIDWMKGHRRVSFDPGVGYPCPGDFMGK